MPAKGTRSGGRDATGAVLKDKRRGQASVHAARSDGEGVGKVPGPATAHGDRARAADGMTRDMEQGKGKGTGRTRRGASRAQRRAAMERM